MSDTHNDPTAWQDEPEADDPTHEEPSAADLDAVEDSATLAEAEAEDNDLGLAGAGIDPFIEPGADGPEGTGIEGADDALIEDTDPDDDLDSPDLPDEFSTDSTTAAEMGNRPGDEMVSEDEDADEVAELSGDDLDLDALADDGIPETIGDSLDED